MKHILIILFVFIITTVHAQNVTLRQEWASPRLGESVDFVAEKRTAEGIKEIGDFSFSGLTKDTGWISIGPLSLKVGDSLYQSDSIRIHVIDSLPAVTSGFWFRFETINGQLFLITEQRMPRNTSIEHEDEGDLFTKINCDYIKESGLKLKENSSMWTHKSVNIGGDVQLIPYMLVMYKIDMSRNFDGEYILQRKDFMRWPENVEFPRIVIKR